MWKLSVVALAVVCLAGCVVERPVHVYEAPPPPRSRVVYTPPPEVVTEPVISVVVEPPLAQPPAIAVPWAPPPMLVEIPPPMLPGAVWVGGYWVWQGTWVWAHGYWATPPQPSYHWVEPYYEHRDGAVIFVAAHWAAPGVVFVPPPMGIHIELAAVRAGAVPGPRPIGPAGVFVPPPPGSRPGLIVPAPIGTPPAVVVSAPPVVNVGMRVQANIDSHNTTVINNITNITRVTVVAPASATASGQAVQSVVPAQAHLAAALPPVVKTFAPQPVSRQPVPAWTPGRPLPDLPAGVAPMPHPASAPMVVQPRPAEVPPAVNSPVRRPPTPEPQRQPQPQPQPAASPRPNAPPPVVPPPQEAREPHAHPSAPHPAPPSKEGRREDRDHPRGHDPKEEREREQRNPPERQ